MLEARSLTKTYDGLTAVDSLSFRVEAGEVLGLVGPNGAGKTTTLRCLSGIIPPTSGEVVIASYPLDREPLEAKRRLAFVPDEPHLFDYLTVWDHLAVFSRIYNVQDGQDRGLRLLGEFGLSDRRNAFPAELSRGMKQKLMIIGALLHRPEVMILDEPLTGLDPRAMRQTKDLLLENAAAGMTVIVSSHMLHLVEEISNRIIIIHRGQKTLDGTLPEIRRAIPELGERAALEDIFLHATEETTD